MKNFRRIYYQFYLKSLEGSIRTIRIASRLAQVPYLATYWNLENKSKRIHLSLQPFGILGKSLESAKDSGFVRG